MAEPRKKSSFGGCDINHIGPPNRELPTAINLTISFEDAMRLHLSIGQALAKLNSYDRSTKAGRDSAMNLCIYHKKKRLTVNPTKLKPEPKS
jgi:hypothetical protein